MSETAISIQNLSKAYGKVQALRQLDLSVRRGEIFGYLGPNGAGKTTTIRCLLDLIRPQQGEMSVLGLDPRRDALGVRELCGYLPGELAVDDNLTAREVLRYFSSLRLARVDWKYVEELSTRLDLDLSRQVKNLSKGNRQKVGLVQALMHKPPVLLMDEPTSGLDPLMQQVVLQMMVEARQSGATVFFSSHILSEVQAIADRVGIIRAGSLVDVADVEDLLRRSLRRVRVRFKEAVNPHSLLAVAGVKLLAQPSAEILQLEVAGEMDGLVKALAGYPLQDLETERPSLEEVFLAYYNQHTK